MKKVYITIFLVISLFFFSFSEVSAETRTYSILEEELNIINEDFFKVKEMATQYSIENNMPYFVIRYNKTSKYYSFVLAQEPLKQDFYTSTSGIRGSIDSDKVLQYVKLYKYENGVLNGPSNYSGISITLDYYGTNNEYLQFYSYLYSNYSLTNKLADDIVITYDNYSYTIESGSEFISLYDHFLNINEGYEEPDLHEGEKIILSNFYTLVIDKINILANSILSNYVYLSIIGVFILIFIIELIRRYL